MDVHIAAKMFSYFTSEPVRFLLLCLSTSSALARKHDAPTATVDSGVLIGQSTHLPDALGPVNRFLGVPFASPPVRFSPPQPVAPRDEPIEATSVGPACIQQFGGPDSEFVQSIFNNPPPDESEDCLYLNVYAPAAPAGRSGRPVLFWMFGGGFRFGSGGLATYDGSPFAAYEDVILVTTNYRTNLFGFPGSPEVPLLEQNLGLLDQRAALEWVQRNIHVFGGDPKKVTVFGESAGAGAIDTFLTSTPKGSSPPFRAAILQSGQASYRSSPSGTNTASWESLVDILDCPGEYSSDLECVRAVDVRELRRIVNEYPLGFRPTPDGVNVVQDAALRRVRGEIPKIPVLVGSNSQESRLSLRGSNNLTAYLESTFGTVAPDVIPLVEAAYPIGTDGLTTDYDVISAIQTDISYTCPSAWYVNASAAVGIPSWRYYFNATFVNTQAAPGLGAYHASEIQMVFGTFSEQNQTTQQYALGQAIQGIWAGFAKNPYRGPGWNAVGTGAAGTILQGAEDFVRGGVYRGPDGNIASGDWNVGVLGDVGNARGTITVLPQSQLDYRCGLFRPIFDAVLSEEVFVPST